MTNTNIFAGKFDYNAVNDYIARVEEGIVAAPSEAAKESLLKRTFKAVENGLSNWLQYQSVQQLPTGDYARRKDGGFIVPPKA